LLVGREDLVGNNEDDVEIADYENFFFVNYTGRGAVSPHSINFVIDIATAETASMY
jgi:hypothetical protein